MTMLETHPQLVFLLIFVGICLFCYRTGYNAGADAEVTKRKSMPLDQRMEELKKIATDEKKKIDKKHPGVAEKLDLINKILR
ncbi:MAG: hypothetical protein AAF135_01170 [Bacteroidota bacterium]